MSKEALLESKKKTLDSLELLLDKDHKLAFNQKKWFKNISEINIQILDQTYTLKAKDNKKELIYRVSKAIRRIQRTTPSDPAEDLVVGESLLGAMIY